MSPLSPRQRIGLPRIYKRKDKPGANALTIGLTEEGPFGKLKGAILNLGDKPITGGLTISGHTYWVIVEYGSSPATPNAGPSPDDPIVLTLPPRTPAPKNHSEWYLIEARRKTGRLVFFHNGRKRVEKAVHHPGVLGRGFLRRLIPTWTVMVQEVMADLFADLQDDVIPKRQQMVDVFNMALDDLLKSVVAATPVSEKTDADGFMLDDEEHDGTHLRDAWGTQLAED